jgi:hypothetical protein
MSYPLWAMICNDIALKSTHAGLDLELASIHQVKVSRQIYLKLKSLPPLVYATGGRSL